MKLHTVTAVLVAFSCIAAVGVASTTLETTLSTNPDEVIDLNYDNLPISPQDAGELQRSMTNAESGSEQERPDSRAGEADEQRSAEASDDGSERQSTSGGESSGGANAQSSQSQSSESGGEPTTEESWLDMLLDFLATWLPLFVGLAVVVAVAILISRYRDRIDRLLRPPASRRADPTPPRTPEPQNAVERAWLSVLTAGDVEDPWRRTPGECASAAVESGLDPDGVDRLRRVFEEVRYGDCEVTESRRRRMERGLSQLDVQRAER